MRWVSLNFFLTFSKKKLTRKLTMDKIFFLLFSASPLPLLSDFTSAVSNNLSPLSLLYDVSRPEDVTVVITEAGLIPVQSVPVLLRDFKPLLQS